MIKEGVVFGLESGRSPSLKKLKIRKFSSQQLFILDLA